MVDPRSPTLLYVVNQATFFLSHRLRLAHEAQACGFRVVVVCGRDSGEHGLAERGFEFRTLPLSRSGFNPFRELRTYRMLQRIYREERPDLVHHVTIKPVIYGTRIARKLGVPAVVNAIPGLGFVFTDHSAVGRLRRMVVNAMYRVALNHPNMRLIFQNREDMDRFIEVIGVDSAHAYLIRGAGIDLDAYPFTAEPDGAPGFVLVARMLVDKGVRDFIEAVRIVARREPSWRFTLVGDVDVGNPSSLTAAELQRWVHEGLVHWVGHQPVVQDYLLDHHVVCLPTFREGLPKSLLEAASVGRAIVASDVAGCREIVRDGVTGLLVPVKDSDALAQAMLRLGNDPDLREKLRCAARDKAELLFSVEDVVHDTFLVYEELLSA